MIQDSELSRRTFVKTSAVGLAQVYLLGFHLPGVADAASANPTEQQSVFSPNAWIRIHPNNTITFICDKAEMGQGASTALAMIIAEELNVSPETLVVENAPANRDYVNPALGLQITGGSTSVASSYDSLRKAGATCLQMLITAAAKKLNVKEDELAAQDGEIFLSGRTQRLTYGELALAARDLPVPEAKLKDPKNFKVIGKNQARLDCKAKITGKARYGIDVVLPNMLSAVVIHSSMFQGKMKSLDTSAAEKMPGVIKIFTISRGVAVVAEKYWQARKASEAVKVTWERTEASPIASEAFAKKMRDLAKNEGGKEFLDRGNYAQARGKAKQTLSEVYTTPFLAHATMEPVNFTADVGRDYCRLYGPTQSAGMAQQLAAEYLGFSLDQVSVETTFIGGGFGRRLAQDYVVEAVEISKTIGKPIKLLWSREDDIKNDIYRPTTYNVISASLNDANEPIAWSHKLVSPSIMSQVAGEYVRTLAPAWLPNPMKRFAGWAAQGLITQTSQDDVALEGSKDFPYNIENAQVHFVQAEAGVPLGFWRSVGHSYTAFVVECFIDELAHTVGKDPYVFRHELLNTAANRRIRGVLELVVKKANWQTPAAKGVGKGLAVHKSFGSYAAQVAEVSLTADGRLKVNRIVCAVDCGRVINPDGVSAQIESGIIFGLSAALKSAITINEEGGVVQSNFHDYEVLRMEEAPKIEVYVIESDEKPSGVGEPGVPPVAPAVGNAVFALTGKRLRELPFKV